jgi:hypothetical protein
MEKSKGLADRPVPKRVDSSDARELPPVLLELAEQLSDMAGEAGDPHQRRIAGGVYTGGG